MDIIKYNDETSNWICFIKDLINNGFVVFASFRT